MKKFLLKLLKHFAIFVLLSAVVKYIYELISPIGLSLFVIIFIAIVIFSIIVSIKDNNKEEILRDISDLFGRDEVVSEVSDFLSISNEDSGRCLMIDGEWGSGKTHLINLVEEQNIDKAKFIYFNPLEMSMKEDLFTEFFSLVNQELPYTSNIFDQLFSNSFGKYSSVYQFFYGKTTQKKKEYILNKISLKNENIVLVFDDLDRLTKENCYEAFKLIAEIRNEKKSKNIKIIILCEAGKIGKKAKEMSLGIDYFDKFFDEVIYLNNSEEGVIEFIKEESIKNIGDSVGVELAFLDTHIMMKSFHNDDNFSFVNIRHAKGIVNKFVLLYKKFSAEIKAEDLFYLSVIKNYYPHLLRHIFNDTKFFLNNSGGTKEVMQEENNSYIKKREYSELEKSLLKKLSPKLFRGDHDSYDTLIKERRFLTEDNFFMIRDYYVPNNFKSDEFFNEKFENLLDTPKEELGKYLQNKKFLDKSGLRISSEDYDLSNLDNILNKLLSSYYYDSNTSLFFSGLLFKIIIKLSPGNDTKEEANARITYYKQILSELCMNGSYVFTFCFIADYMNKPGGHSNEKKEDVYRELTDHLKEILIGNSKKLSDSLSEDDFHFYFTETSISYNFDEDFLIKIFSDKHLYDRMIKFYEERVKKDHTMRNKEERWEKRKNKFIENYERLQSNES